MLLVLRTSRPAYGLVQTTLTRAALEGPSETLSAGSGPSVPTAIAACLRAWGGARPGSGPGPEADPITLPPPDVVALLALHGPALIAAGDGVWLQILRA